MRFRTDRNNNPFACIVQICQLAGLVYGTDYIGGDTFTSNNVIFTTAKLLHDPVELCIYIIDKISFYTQHGSLRWTYIAIPQIIWTQLSIAQKILVIKFMYQKEGGTELLPLFEAELEKQATKINQ